MTTAEILSAIRALSLEDLQTVREELPKITYERFRAARQAACLHEYTHEQRRGDRSIDTICRTCGVIVEWR